MEMIAAVDRNWGIGKGGDLLVHIPADMEFFKERTMGNLLLMGRKTFESFPGKKALPGRINVVLTRNPQWTGEGARTARSEAQLQQILSDYKGRFEQICVIGGGEIYRQYLPLCDQICLTHIDAVYEADTYFPNLDQDERFLPGEILQKGSWKGIRYEMRLWRRKNK